MPGHLHYVVQPVTGRAGGNDRLFGPALQVRMFQVGDRPSDDGIAEVAERARVLFRAATSARGSGAT